VAVATSASTLCTVAWFICTKLKPTWCSSWIITNWVPSWQPKTWIILLLLTWIIVIFKGTVSTVRRIEKDAAKKVIELKTTHDSDCQKKSQEIKILETKVRELETTIKAEVKHQEPNLSAAIKTETTSKRLLLQVSSQFSTDHLMHATVSQMTLMIYNQGEKTVRLRGYELSNCENIAEAHEFQLHDLLTPDTSAAIDFTEPLLAAISGQGKPNFESLSRKYTIQIVVLYLQDSIPKSTQPFDFTITCQRQGGLSVKLFAEAVIH